MIEREPCVPSMSTFELRRESRWVSATKQVFGLQANALSSRPHHGGIQAPVPFHLALFFQFITRAGRSVNDRGIGGPLSWPSYEIARENKGKEGS